MSYITDIEVALSHELSAELPDHDAESLVALYALLALVRGTEVNSADVHNAWAVWAQSAMPGHPAVVPFGELDPATQAEDRPFVAGIRRVAAEFGL